MSMNFTRTSEMRLAGTITTISLPFSLIGWFRSASSTVDGRIVSIGTASSVTDQGSLSAKGDTGGDPVSALAYSTEVAANSSSGYTVNTWHLALGIFRSATDRSAFIDGGSEGTNTSSRTPTGAAIVIGARHANAGVTADHFDGQLAHVAIYNVDLSSGQIAGLASRVNPMKIAKVNNVNYWHLLGYGNPTIDYKQGTSGLTWVNSPTQSELNPPVGPIRTRRQAA